VTRFVEEDDTSLFEMHVQFKRQCYLRQYCSNGVYTFAGLGSVQSKTARMKTALHILTVIVFICYLCFIKG